MIAGAVIGTLLGLALLAGVIVGIIVLVIMVKPKNKYKYTPPTQSNGVRSSTRTTHLTTTYKQVGNGSSPSGSPSVNVVRPGKYNAGHHAPSTSFTPSAPPSYEVAVKGNSVGNVRPAPPKPVSRPTPPKPLSHAPPPPTKPSPSSYRPPVVKPAPALRYPASSAARPPPPPSTQKPQGE